MDEALAAGELGRTAKRDLKAKWWQTIKDKFTKRVKKKGDEPQEIDDPEPSDDEEADEEVLRHERKEAEAEKLNPKPKGNLKYDARDGSTTSSSGEEVDEESSDADASFAPKKTPSRVPKRSRTQVVPFESPEKSTPRPRPKGTPRTSAPGIVSEAQSSTDSQKKRGPPGTAVSDPKGGGGSLGPKRKKSKEV